METRTRLDRRVASRAQRGFTLIELMVVVVIITIVSTIAIPGVVKRMKTNRTRQAAEDIAFTFRQARMRAVGRTSAVLVRYNNGVVEVREAIQGGAATDPGCARLPETSCSLPDTRWNSNVRSQLVEQTAYETSGDFDLEVTDDQGASPADTLEMCFAPSGRAYIRNNFASTTAFTPWLLPVRIDVERNDKVGIRRAVLVAPTGTARVVAAP